MMTLTKTITLAAALALTSTAAFADGDGHGDGVESKVLTAEDRDFVVAFGPVEFADAFGSRAEGPHGTYGKFPAGFVTPGHTHSHGYRAVVLEGEMTNPFAGEENPPVMGPGSFWSVEAGADHTTACVSDTPCVFLMWGGEDFDFIPNDS